ncbi:MAG: hypothetical protein JOY64_00195 [Alphaproteobacteria bacterium]|nr:hypothetical protein [Alphaproteobacteria bacterium]MBV8406023.1 hypothetical protein [Alphaproteobacteria bacterium]
MQMDIATRLVAAALALDGPLGALDGIISELPEGEEKDECRGALADVIGIVARHLIFRVYRQYPELDPDR